MSLKTDKSVPTGRFAPTPSGRMHLGNALCAMLSYLSVKSKGGRFVLRIEDLDAARCPKESALLIIDDLRRLGFEFDGEILWQSERSSVYELYEKLLDEKGMTYPCFCSRAQLHAAAAPHLSDGSYVYDGRCSRLTREQIVERLKLRKPCKRVRVPDETVTFTDGICGENVQNIKEECGDFIIRRSDGVFAYQLAVVVDDGLSGVTEVVRGDDLLSSSARQIWLFEQFGFSPPIFYHIPLLCDGDGRRLSKRDGDSLTSALHKYSPHEIIGALSYSCGLTERYSPVTLSELIPLFNWNKIRRDCFRLPHGFLAD